MVSRLWSRLSRGGDKGLVEAGVAAGGALLVVGALVGNGLTATVVDMSDGQTWLPGQNGRIVQVNPATGTPERKLVVGDDGSHLAIAQREGNLIVSDEDSGEMTAIDLTALVASGSRGSSADDLVLVGGGHVVLVDTDPGTVRAVDPLSLADLSRPYRTPEKIADAVIDDDGTVWVMDDTGTLTELTYGADAGRFQTGTQRPVDGAGSRSRLVPHEKGVTVFASDGGAVVQVGAGSDVAVTVPDLAGSVAAAPRSPSGLVPASATDAGEVFMLADRQMLQVDVAGLGCDRPGGPQVYQKRVYVPCLGTGRVMVLDRHGKRAGADIVVPGGGDPTFTADEGRLFVTTDRDARTVVVQPDGSTGVVDLDGGDVPEQDAQRQPAISVPRHDTDWSVPQADAQRVDTVREDPRVQQAKQRQRAQHRDQRERAERERRHERAEQNDHRRDDRHDRPRHETPDPGVSTPGHEAPDPITTDDPGDRAPDTDVTADPDATTDPETEDEPTPGATQPTAPADEPTADPGDEPTPQDTPTAGPTADPTPTTEPTADPTPTGEPTDDPSADPTPTDEPTDEPTPDPTPTEDPVVQDPPTELAATVKGKGIHLTWTAPTGDVLEYIVTSSDGAVSQTVSASTTSVDLTGLTCGRTITLTVTASYDGGAENAASISTDTPECPAAPKATAATAVKATASGRDVTVTWKAASSGADEYLVQPSGSGDWVSAKTATSLTFPSMAYGSHTFTVRTVLGDSTKDSSPSKKVTVAGKPGKPGKPSVSVDPDLAPMGYMFTASWKAAKANGAKVTYTVEYVGGGHRETITTTNTEIHKQIACTKTAICERSVGVTVTVTATNAKGSSAPVSGSDSAEVPEQPAPPKPKPKNNDTVISGIMATVTDMRQIAVSITIRFDPPQAWKDFDGTCTLHATNAGKTVTTQKIDCANPQPVGLNSPTKDAFELTAYVTTSGSVSVKSAPKSRDVPARDEFAHCDPNKKACEVPVLAPGDPDVGVVTASWTIPDVPNPPVLAAGVVLLGAAGLLRTRRRGRRGGAEASPLNTDEAE